MHTSLCTFSKQTHIVSKKRNVSTRSYGNVIDFKTCLSPQTVSTSRLPVNFSVGSNSTVTSVVSKSATPRGTAKVTPFVARINKDALHGVCVNGRCNSPCTVLYGTDNFRKLLSPGWRTTILDMVYSQLREVAPKRQRTVTSWVDKISSTLNVYLSTCLFSHFCLWSVNGLCQRFADGNELAQDIFNIGTWGRGWCGLPKMKRRFIGVLCVCA